VLVVLTVAIKDQTEVIPHFPQLLLQAVVAVVQQLDYLADLVVEVVEVVLLLLVLATQADILHQRAITEGLQAQQTLMGAVAVELEPQVKQHLLVLAVVAETV
jgi:hypothetical protein